MQTGIQISCVLNSVSRVDPPKTKGGWQVTRGTIGKLVCLMVALFRGVFCLFRDNGIRGIGWRSFVKIRNHHYYSMTTNKWYEKGLYFSFSKFPNPVARHEPTQPFFCSIGTMTEKCSHRKCSHYRYYFDYFLFHLFECLFTSDMRIISSEITVTSFFPVSVGMTRNPRLP